MVRGADALLLRSNPLEVHGGNGGAERVGGGGWWGAVGWGRWGFEGWLGKWEVKKK